MADDQKWNWQQPDWPEFRYDRSKLEGLEAEFWRQAGVFVGTLKHAGEDEKQQLTVEILSDEALNSSEIEGEILNRESLQSSIRRSFGLPGERRKIPLAEQGMAQMRVDAHRHFAAPLSHARLFRWHEMLMSGHRDVREVGHYRTSASPMQIISGSLYRTRVHYEAPPSRTVRKEMAQFVKWFNRTAPKGAAPLPALIRAGMAHWYFVSVHPFEDGNGRLARALAEKALSQSLGAAVLIALSQVINRKRKAYYEVLEYGNRDNEITDWLVYFARTILEAQKLAQEMVDFLVGKTRFFDRVRGLLNERQEKVLVHMFREGSGGFRGGLSAEKYLRMTGASRATVTRDLQDLVEKKALERTGELKSTRYHLVLGERIRLRS